MALGNPFLLMAGLYLVLDVLAVVALALGLAGLLPPIAGVTWLRVHLLTIGVVTQTIFGTLPELAARRIGVEQPGIRMMTALWLLLNTSLILLLIGMPASMTGLAAAGAVGVLAAIALMLGAVLRRAADTALITSASFPFYVTGPIFLVAGILMALSILLGWPAPGGPMGLIEAHIHANVWGFLGLIVAGGLYESIPAQVGHPLWAPAAVRPTFGLLTAGGVALVIGPWLGVMPLTMLGLAGYLVGTALLLSNLVQTVIAAGRWTANLAHVFLAYAWMFVPAFVAPAHLIVTGRLPSGAVEASAVSGLIFGWLLQIVIGALLTHLREEQGEAAVGNGWWLSVVTLNLGVLAIWLSPFAGDLERSRALTVLGYALIVAGWLPPLGAVLGRLFPRFTAATRG